MTRDDTLEEYRAAVLKALDGTTRRLFGNVVTIRSNEPGATDADLPKLFKTIDAQADKIARRLGITLEESGWKIKNKRSAR